MNLLPSMVFMRRRAYPPSLKTFWKVAYGKSIPNQYEPVRDLPFPWKKVSLRIDSLPTERKMLAPPDEP